MNAKSRFSEAQIIDTIKEQEAGLPTIAGLRICATSNLWKMKTPNSSALLVETMLDNTVLKDIPGKNRRRTIRGVKRRFRAIRSLAAHAA